LTGIKHGVKWARRAPLIKFNLSESTFIELSLIQAKRCHTGRTKALCPQIRHRTPS
jgi:hypothetical protein